MENQKIKVCYILSYRSPNYIRTRVLLKAIEKIKYVEVIKTVNNYTSFFRYVETASKLVYTRFTHNPDVYILGFRGHEIFWPVRIITLGKPLIFDEFINMNDWMVFENKKLKQDSLITRISRLYVKSILLRSKIILSDTQLDANSSSNTYKIPIEKYRVVYVGEDEENYKLKHNINEPVSNENTMRVFFYGNMAPLHGVKIIMNAALNLKNEPINFIIVGGKGKPEIVKYIKDFINENNLKNVEYTSWLDFNDIKKQIKKADICLGGPFGGTSQAKRVVTGKTYQFLASGKPTIIGKIDEDLGLKNKDNCIIVRQASVNDLIDALKWSLDNRKSLRNIGKKGHELFMSKFSISIISKQMEDIINESKINLSQL